MDSEAFQGWRPSDHLGQGTFSTSGNDNDNAVKGATKGTHLPSTGLSPAGGVPPPASSTPALSSNRSPLANGSGASEACNPLSTNILIYFLTQVLFSSEKCARSSE